MARDYFVKDEALNTIDNDEFGHGDLANNIRMMIDNTSAPFNIAIVGKWGMGKSSLINMVKKPLKDNPKEYIVAEINAWKYQKEEFGRAFFKQLLQEVTGENITTQERFEQVLHQCLNETVKTNEPDNSNSPIRKGKKIIEFLRKNKVAIVCFLLLLLVSFTAVMSYKSVALDLSPWSLENIKVLLRVSFLCYCKNVVVVLIVPLLVWMGKLYMDQLVAKKNFRMDVNVPLETRDDYETYLRAALNEKSNKKIITIIDDLDRLSSDKIVEALDALKIFMDLPGCIFIVPFDDGILKKALTEERLNNLNSVESELNSELVLDKLFQYKIYIPEMVKINIKEYAVKLFQENCADFVHDYMRDDMKEAHLIIRNIIIHNHVKTPRQVKKLLNAFINNVIVATQREKDGRGNRISVEQGFVSSPEGLRMLAKMSVLQADFNEFYDLLFINNDAIIEMMSIHSGKESDVPEELEQYFIKCDNTAMLKPEYQSLIDFLYHTDKYNTRSIVPYLYMAQDSISALTGDKRQQDFMAAVTSCNIPTCSEMLKQVPTLAKSLERFLNVTDDYDEVMSACIIAINLLESIQEEYREGIVLEVTNRIQTSMEYAEDNGIRLINFDALFNMQAISTEPNVFDVCIQRYVEEALSVDTTVQIFHSILLHSEDLSDATSNVLKVQLDEFINEHEYAADDIREICDDLEKSCILEFISEKAFQKIISEFLDNQEFDDDSMVSFKKYFRIFVNEKNIVTYIEYLEKMIGFSELHELLIELLTDSILEKLSLEEHTRLIQTLIAISREKLTEHSYSLFLRLSCDVEYIEETINLDLFMYSAMEESPLFTDMVIHYVEEGNDIDLLHDTLSDLSINAMNNEESLDELCMISKYYKGEQKNEIVNRVKALVGYTVNKEYGNECNIIKKLYLDSELAESIVGLVSTTIVTNLSTHGDKLNYLQFAIFVIEVVIEDLDATVLGKVVKLYLAKLKQFPVDIVNSLNNINCYLDSSTRLEVIETFKSNSPKTVIDSIAMFYYANKDILDDNHSDDLSDFIVSHLDDLSDTIRALKELNEYYEMISEDELAKISRYVVVREEILSDAAIYLKKFFDNLDIIKSSELMIALWNENSAIAMNNLMFMDGSTHSLTDLIHYVAENVTNYSHNDIGAVLQIIDDLDVNCIEDWLELAKGYLHNNQNLDLNNKMLTRVEKFVSDKKLKKQDTLYVLFLIYNNTSSMELKKSTAKLVVEYKLASKFKSLLGEEGKVEFEKL